MRMTTNREKEVFEYILLFITLNYSCNIRTKCSTFLRNILVCLLHPINILVIADPDTVHIHFKLFEARCEADLCQIFLDGLDVFQLCLVVH